jgi:hypothetical protein
MTSFFEGQVGVLKIRYFIQAINKGVFSDFDPCENYRSERHTNFGLKEFPYVLSQVCCLISGKFSIENILIILWII